MNKGFTLIELLIVVLIIAILAAIAVPNFLEFQTRAKVSRVKSDMRVTATMLEAYYVDNNEYPISEGGGSSTIDFYCEYLWWRENVALDRTYGCKVCTTPIAYISSHPIDPFTRTDGGEDFSFFYLNYSGANKDGLGINNPTAVVFNGPDGSVRNVAWSIYSPGPDGEFIYNGVIYNHLLRTSTNYQSLLDGTIMLYDPTNGTISAGSIWRDSGGIPE